MRSGDSNLTPRGCDDDLFVRMTAVWLRNTTTAILRSFVAASPFSSCLPHSETGSTTSSSPSLEKQVSNPFLFLPPSALTLFQLAPPDVKRPRHLFSWSSLLEQRKISSPFQNRGLLPHQSPQIVSRPSLFRSHVHLDTDPPTLNIYTFTQM